MSHGYGPYDHTPNTYTHTIPKEHRAGTVVDGAIGFNSGVFSDLKTVPRKYIYLLFHRMVAPFPRLCIQGLTKRRINQRGLGLRLGVMHQSAISFNRGFDFSIVSISYIFKGKIGIVPIHLGVCDSVGRTHPAMAIL